MDTVVIKEYGQYNEAEICSLYNSVGWSVYCRAERLRQAFAASVCILAAYERNKLIGLLRAVGDGVTVVLLQDVLVHPGYQRRGIGRRLVACLLARYKNVRKYVLTDDLPRTVGFYKAVGFTPVENAHCRALTRSRF